MSSLAIFIGIVTVIACGAWGAICAVFFGDRGVIAVIATSLLGGIIIALAGALVNLYLISPLVVQ